MASSRNQENKRQIDRVIVLVKYSPILLRKKGDDWYIYPLSVEHENLNNLYTKTYDRLIKFSNLGYTMSLA